MPAYDESYLDGMLVKTRYLFKLIGRNCLDPFSVITNYMKSDYRKYMDMGNPIYLNKTPKQIMEELDIRIQNDHEISEKYDEFILEWMADIYVYMQWEYDLSSSEIVAKLTPEKLYKQYYPLHETSVENGVRKLLSM